MAKPNDTRIVHASSNPNPGNNRYPPQFIALLEALLASQASAPPIPVYPKHCRPKRIRPQRRVTVGTDRDQLNQTDIPRIRLCGHWLAVAGFDVNTRVRVHAAQGILILVPELAA